MASNEHIKKQGKRIHWMDNLRTITILLVVLYHTGGVYESGGLWGWFWIVDDPNTITWVGIVGIMFDIMVMPIMVFISGYLTPASLQNKTGWEFIKGKVKRLMIPWAIAVFTLIPIYKFIFLYSRSLPQEPWKYRVGPNWKANEYGYQWWSIKAGNYRYNMAWGHGGQQIILIDELDLMVALLADALYARHGDEPWKIEKSNLNLVADFVTSLPRE